MKNIDIVAKFISNLFLSKYSILLLIFTMNAIEVNLSQEKISFINDAYQRELQYWKRAALEQNLSENEAKELLDLALSRDILIRKAEIKNANKMNIYEMIFYLKSQYSTDRNQIKPSFRPENFIKIHERKRKHEPEE